VAVEIALAQTAAVVEAEAVPAEGVAVEEAAINKRKPLNLVSW
jgi:hypothetical protein